MKKQLNWLAPTEARVFNQQLMELFKNSNLSAVYIHFGMPILSFMLLSPEKPVHMVIWCLLIMVTKAINWWIVHTYKKQLPTLTHTSPNIYPLMLLIFIDGIVWASLFSMDLRPTHNLQSVTVMAVLTGITVIYMIFSAPLMHMAISLMAGEIVSLSVQWLFIDDSR